MLEKMKTFMFNTHPLKALTLAKVSTLIGFDGSRNHIISELEIPIDLKKLLKFQT